MVERLWTVARFPSGAWRFGGKRSGPVYSECELWEISAVTGRAAGKKAQAKRSRNRTQASTDTRAGANNGTSMGEVKLSFGEGFRGLTTGSVHHVLSDQYAYLAVLEFFERVIDIRGSAPSRILSRIAITSAFVGTDSCEVDDSIEPICSSLALLTFFPRSRLHLARP
ncbi:hypothetical protein LMG27174_06585 [Paraburkholderia rhynchosiae]|uniref:Uncharacterized protein n=1 Tax=Paraburkholderia rhynchosiae TaxID=487049 RepID=A0A6J5CMV3_9BURK|nr:hypothetical protein LMG27174_06585 [Paraburkholderia rhynchosiae]